MTLSRRDFFNLSNLMTASTEAVSLCLTHDSDFTVETQDSPFFEHFHYLSIPIKALLQPPSEGVTLTTTPVDLDSYDIEGFKSFIAKYSFDEKAQLSHFHEIKISQSKLVAIASGEKNVEIRVISKAGNYVHNFLITASPMTLAILKKKSVKE